MSLFKIKVTSNWLITRTHNVSSCARTALETDLRIEREWRGNLQKNLDAEKTKYAAQQKELQTLRQVRYQVTSGENESLTFIGVVGELQTKPIDICSSPDRLCGSLIKKS